MKERQYLKKSIRLCGESDGKKFIRTFHIIKKISVGASVICYEAYYENSSKGILKEFYPRDAYSMERNEDGQLVHSEYFKEAKTRFLQDEKEYIEPYDMLLHEKRNNTDLAGFIPPFEIYHGCDEESNIIGTVYIWTPEPELETFDKICTDVHKNPIREPEHKLVLVLSAIESLAKCICELHKAGLIHRDIKPSNFGFLKRGNETLTQTLSMFDINSICSIYNMSQVVIGTEGYMEPEAGYELANNQTDIYAIGATLFYAIIVSDEARERKYLYSDELYEELRELVNASKLICASESNSHPRLRNILIRILQKCLCERGRRYGSCEELIEDMETAMYYALPSDIVKKKRSGEQWVLRDVEKSLDINKEKNSTLALQYHLYSNPLYHFSDLNTDELNVSVFGFGNYGRKFLDICLQIGQMKGKRLNVTVVSDDITDKEQYLEERPELAEFFCIDDGRATGDESYGNVMFETATFLRRNQRKNKFGKSVCDYHEIIRQKKPHYIFIALGEDGLNLNVAKACREVAKALKISCLVNFTWENEHILEELKEDLLPVYVCDDVKKSAIYSEIERMAFNTHLIWKKDLNIDSKMVKAEFRRKYNHDSCVSSVLSLKYKLYSIGIDLEKCDFKIAAKIFVSRGLSTSKKSKDVKNELIYIEHRRWVVEKLCAGWHRIHDLEECMSGATKDEKRKRHVCLVTSRADQKLTEGFANNGNYSRWDTASESELVQLDELDRLSVELHRRYVERAEIVKKRNLLTGNNISGIRSLIEGNKKAVAAFQEWFCCLKEIWNGDRAKVHLYKGLRNAFLNSLDELPMENKMSAAEQVKAFEIMFYPVLASMEYKDFKLNDTALIDNIPFILTYSESICMAIPYTTGSNTEIFSNIASAAIVNPAKILYLCLIEKKNELDEVKQSLPYIAEFMQKKKFRASVEFALAYTRDVALHMTDALEDEFKDLSNGRVRQVKQFFIAEMAKASDIFRDYLDTRKKNRLYFTVEKNNSRLSYLLMGAEVYKNFSNYQFDSKTMKFYSLQNCDEFAYIKKRSYITVTDMAAFKHSTGESTGQPEFFDDYKSLWKKYQEKSVEWKHLCRLLKEYSKTRDVIASFRKNKEKTRETQEYRYILPFVCCLPVKRILDFLTTHEIVEDGSRVNGLTTDSCEIIINDRCGYKKIYDKLFANVYPLMLPDALNMYLNVKNDEAIIKFDNLVVDGISVNEGCSTEIMELMMFFEKKGYVINLELTDGCMKYTYSTRQIKQLMTTEGRILEIYTYHKAKETGRFDDIVSSFEVNWENTEVKNEFDCILTQGFSSLFVECKARADLEQDFYYKAAALAEQFGINAKVVLIADTQEKSSDRESVLNEMQRKRGSMMNVITIWKKDEINNIDHTLLKIIKGTYSH